MAIAMHCEACERPCPGGALLCSPCAAEERRADEHGTYECNVCQRAHDGWFGELCEPCFDFAADVRARNACGELVLPEHIDVLMWAQPVLVRGLLLRVDSLDGRVVSSAILFRDGGGVALNMAELRAVTARGQTGMAAE